MKFELFKQLYSEALEYEELDMFIAERGWQKWMEQFDPSPALTEIFTLANSTLQETRERLGISRASFARMYDIPLNTLEKWDYGTNNIATYLKTLIDYSIFMG